MNTPPKPLFLYKDIKECLKFSLIAKKQWDSKEACFFFISL